MRTTISLREFLRVQSISLTGSGAERLRRGGTRDVPMREPRRRRRDFCIKRSTVGSFPRNCRFVRVGTTVFR